MSSPSPAVPSGAEPGLGTPPAPTPGAPAAAGPAGAEGGAGASAAAPGATPEPPLGAKPPDPKKPSPAPPEPIAPVAPKINIELKNSLVNSAPRRAFLFSQDSGVPITQIAEIASAAHFVYHTEFVKETLDVLKGSRVVVLMGGANCGKESMARYLAGRLRQDSSLERDTLLVQPLPGEMGLNLLAAMRGQRKLHERTVIFRDALERGNTGIRDFLALLTDDGATNVRQSLKEINAYLVFTAASGSLPPECIAGIPARLRPIIPAPSPELLRHGVEVRIAEFLNQCADPTLCAGVTEDLKRQIAERASTMSRAARFITSHLAAVLRHQTTVQKAFDELDDLSSWFQDSSADDQEAWIYALALIVSHSLGRGDDVPWGEFSVFHDAIRAHVLRWRKQKTAERPLDEQRLQECAGAETKRDPILARDLIGFRDPGAPRRLWGVLLNNFRSLVNGLVPVLLELAMHSDVTIRVRAAQALGRIGSLDAQALTANWLYEWSGTEGYKQKALAGYLAQGVFSMGEREYRRFLLESLDRFARTTGVLMAVAAYKQIAIDEFPVAMERLKKIAESQLAPALNLGDQLRQLDRKLARLNVLAAEVMREALAAFYVELLEKDADLAQAVKYTIVSISITVGLAPVLGTLRQWAVGSQVMGALVCLWFLQDDGIARELTDRNFEFVPHNGDQTEIVSCNGMVGSLIDDPKATETLVRFLQTMYAALMDFFPPDLAFSLIHLIFEFLKEWVQGSLGKPPCREVMVELVGQLLRSSLRELHERTYDWLSSGDFSNGEMAAFAKDARRFSIQAGRLAVG